MTPSSRKLTSEEVSALVGSLSDGGGGGGSSIVADDAQVRDFVFGSDDLSLLGDYYALRMINERFSRMARTIFLPMLRIQPRISSFPPEVKSFDEYCAGLDSFMSLTTSRIDELRGHQMLALHPEFISLLTNSYYGGRLKRPAGQRKEFTATESRIIEIVSDGLNNMLQVAWRDLTPVTFSETAREENVQFASFVDSDDTVIVCSFVVQLPNVDPASFDIVYPLQTLKPIASLLRSRVQSEVIEDDLTWRDKLERAVLNVKLDLTARLCEPKVSLGRLIRLRAGDVLPVQINETVEVRLENNPIFLGEVGDLGGQTAVSLTKRITQ